MKAKTGVNKKTVLIVCIGIGLAIGLIFVRAYANGLPLINHAAQADVSMSIVNSVIDQGATNVTACLDLPSAEDWFPEGALVDGNKTKQAQKVELVDWRNPQTLAEKRRCFQFTFAAESSPTAKLRIMNLKTSLPETLTQADCDRALSKIKLHAADFSFSCIIGNHGIAFDLLNLPEGMTDVQARMLIEDALTNTIDGPWELPISQ